MYFPAILSNYNGMTAYICRRFIPTTAFLAWNASFKPDNLANDEKDAWGKRLGTTATECGTRDEKR